MCAFAAGGRGRPTTAASTLAAPIHARTFSRPSRRDFSSVARAASFLTFCPPRAPCPGFSFLPLPPPPLCFDSTAATSAACTGAGACSISCCRGVGLLAALSVAEYFCTHTTRRHARPTCMAPPPLPIYGPEPTSAKPHMSRQQGRGLSSRSLRQHTNLRTAVPRRTMFHIVHSHVRLQSPLSWPPTSNGARHKRHNTDFRASSPPAVIATYTTPLRHIPAAPGLLVCPRVPACNAPSPLTPDMQGHNQAHATPLHRKLYRESPAITAAPQSRRFTTQVAHQRHCGC